jgi:hypothetical protein
MSTTLAQEKPFYTPSVTNSLFELRCVKILVLVVCLFVGLYSVETAKACYTAQQIQEQQDVLNSTLVAATAAWAAAAAAAVAEMGSLALFFAGIAASLDAQAIADSALLATMNANKCCEP